MQDRTRSQRLVAELSAGVILGILSVAISISLAVLIYSGDLSDFVAQGIGLSLTATLLIGTTIALTSSLPGTIATIQDAPAAVLAVTAAGIAAAATATAPPQTAFVTVVATMMIATLAAAAVMLVAGFVRLGRIVHYLPYPVVGGFLAGTGWLLLVGGFGVMTELPTGRVLSGALFEPGMPERWLGGVAVALALLVITPRSRHVLTWPLLLLGTTALFYLVLAASGGSVVAWREQGLLLGPFPGGGRLGPIDYRELAAVRWDLVVRHAAGPATAVFIGIMSVLLNAVGLELATERKIDLDRELRSSGLANVFAGLAGGTIGYPILSFTTLNYRAGGRGRLSSLTAVAVVALALLLGTDLLTFIPTLLVGGVLVFLGLSFLIDWVYSGLFRLGRLEYAVVLLILLVIAVSGFLQGVAIGIVAAVFLFAVSYSRNEIVKDTASGTVRRSRVNRPPRQRELLQERGHQLLILTLQGYIFFGTAHALLERIEQRIATTPDLRLLLIDFAGVSGIDSTALTRFETLAQQAPKRGHTLLLSGLAPPIHRLIENSGALTGASEVRLFPTLDSGLEWAEERLLDENDGAAESETLELQLQALQGDHRGVAQLMGYLERCTFPAGHLLIRQGEPADDLYFLESGQVTAQIEREGSAPLRLETMRGGTMIGELAFFARSERSASVVVDAPSVVHRLTRSALQEMEANSAEATACFYRSAARLLSGRAMHLVEVVEALQR